MGNSHKLFYSFILGFLILPLILQLSCSSPTEPPPDDKTTKWEVIPELAEADVRYILKHENTLYLTALFTGRNYRGSVWKTNDGDNWTMLRTFEKAVGPLAINGDSLYCLGDSLFRYIIPLDKWENVCRPWPLTSDVQAVSEMIFLSDELYAVQNRFDVGGVYKIYFDGNIEDLTAFYNYRAFAKFIKKTISDDWCYARGMYHVGGFYIFNREGYTLLRDGLSQEVLLNPPTNSMEINNDTLFAGFRFPGVIKYLDEYNVWIDYTDTIPCQRDSTILDYIEPTEIAFLGDKLFVSTDALGVMEWKNGIGWKDLSAGLKTYDWGNEKLFNPIVFLESISETLLAAYGEPGYAGWGGVGVYKLKIN